MKLLCSRQKEGRHMDQLGQLYVDKWRNNYTIAIATLMFFNNHNYKPKIN